MHVLVEQVLRVVSLLVVSLCCCCCCACVRVRARYFVLYKVHWVTTDLCIGGTSWYVG